jgi:ribose 1,5-bisphosphokinase
MNGSGRGTLFAVVGPSGAGKDTLIAAGQQALAGDARYLFARRVVTRPQAAGGELHESATSAEFSRLARAGAFALSWTAHGLSYGIRQEIAPALAGGRHVVVNLSRSVVGAAREKFAPLIVIEVTAAPEILAQRLAARSRESAADLAERLARADAVTVSGEARRIDNSGELAPAIAAFLAALGVV